VLWVKGSGGDIGSMKMDGFSTLYMDKLRALKGKYRGVDQFEDEMVGYLPHCTFNLNPARRQHRYAAARLCAARPCRSRAFRCDHRHRRLGEFRKDLTKDIFGDEIGWLPWKKPGYMNWVSGWRNWLSKIRNMRGAVLESHGLFTWADDREGLLSHHARDHQQGRCLAGRKDGRQARLRWSGADRHYPPTNVARLRRG
jgi:hypothetical protein